MAIDISGAGAEPAPPAAGTTGHFSHHTWLRSAVTQLSTKGAGVPATVPEVSLTGTNPATNADLATAVLAIRAQAAVLDKLVTALNESGIVKKV